MVNMYVATEKVYITGMTYVGRLLRQ